MFIELTTYKKTVKSELIKFLIKFYFNFLNWLIKVCQSTLFRTNQIKCAKKILIFRTGSIGDSVCALPAINTIVKNFPDAKIDILTNTGKSSLRETGLKELIDKTIVSNIIDYYGTSFKELKKILKLNRYDLLIQLPQSLTTLRRELRNLFILKGLGFKKAIGFEINRIKIFAKWQEKLFYFVNERERLLKMLERYGLQSYGMVYSIENNSESKSKINKLTLENNLKDTSRNIAMVIGAKRSQNRWPINYFNDVADYLQRLDYNIIVVGNEKDALEAAKIEGNKVFNFCGMLSILETAEILKHCSMTISNDTGPMHLSYAVGTPVIAIFSSWQQPGLWEPPLDGNNVIFRNYQVHCTMCLIENCPDNICMQGIKPDKIIEKLKNKLD